MLAFAPAALGSDRDPAANGPIAAVAQPVEKRAGAVRDYWTKRRIRAAKPAERLLRGVEKASRPSADPGGPPTLVEPAAPGAVEPGSGLVRGLLAESGGAARARAQDVSGSSSGFPERTHGKVLFRIVGGSDPGNYQCSGTVVRSPSHTLAWTAGHCVYDSQFGGGFATNWVFLPGFRDGVRPFGTWAARELLTTRGWVNEDLRYDAGAAVLARDGNGRGIQDAVGARGIAFNQPREQRYRAFGYPAVSPYSGGRLHVCDSAYRGDDRSFGPPRPMRIVCDQTAGASGGGWVVDDRFVASLTSYGYECGSVLIIIPCHNPEEGRLFGPYFGGTIEGLYRDARGTSARCAKAEATNVGGGGADDFDGTAADNVFKVRRGGDVVEADRGADRACGGGGGDVVSGGGGADVLRGGRGRDTLVGGPGRDVCHGGKGRDRAFSCKVRKKIR